MQSTDHSAFVAQMRAMSIPALARLYLPEQRLFAFRVRRNGKSEQLEGVSRRYTAIALIGLATESESDARRALHGASPQDVCGALLDGVANDTNLGDAALICWAAKRLDHPAADRALERMCQLWEATPAPMTVEASWVLTAACLSREHQRATAVRDQAAKALLDAVVDASGVFPHVLGDRNTGARAHVACFADQVYPIYALSKLAALKDIAVALNAANRCAAVICDRMGAAGQWWWHYDYRTGDALEGYPVYAVHQDAMGPMALLVLRDAGGTDCSRYVNRGLDWLKHAPEMNGGSLVDEASGWIWRKVARREPRKLARRMQAAASKLSPSLRIPGVNQIFPP
ncbi:MAG: hypothetical protein HZB38_12900, partial [Planctomycetes bacterium]|nr:hypothetical protein [Planctomycetota bacterium]